MANAHEHLEHAEHAEHAHEPFDKRVAVSVAIVAAVLAGISMLGHRKHNEVLQLTTEANIHHTHVGLIERGERNSSLDVAYRIARALGLPLSALIVEAEKHGRAP